MTLEEFHCIMNHHYNYTNLEYMLKKGMVTGINVDLLSKPD
jgi:hypothetical protein